MIMKMMLVVMMAIMMTVINIDMMMVIIMKQVGPGDDYVLTIGGFNDALSTLGDSMAYHNGMKFSAK